MRTARAIFYSLRQIGCRAMIAFEIHTLRDKKWRILSIYDDFETARHEARMTAERGFEQGVLVIQEDYDPDTNKATWRTRFRAGRFANKVWGPVAAMRRVSRRSETRNRQRQQDRQREGLPYDERAFAASPSGIIKPILALIVLVFVGLGALYSIRYVAELLE